MGFDIIGKKNNNIGAETDGCANTASAVDT